MISPSGTWNGTFGGIDADIVLLELEEGRLGICEQEGVILVGVIFVIPAVVGFIGGTLSLILFELSFLKCQTLIQYKI